MNVERMVIIGAGTMGTGIAQVAAQASLEVTVIDTAPAAIDQSRRSLQRSLEGSVEREKLTPEQAAQVRELIAWSNEWGAVAEADWVIEAVFEDMTVKRNVLKRVGELVPDHARIASNTSTLRICGLSDATGCSDRFIGMHFFNPPPAMKLVEVVPCVRTSDETTEAAVELCKRMGKEPLVAPDIPGFFVNRGFGALLSAAIDIWLQGAEPAAIDAAMEMGLGHRMGPLATADLIGLDVCLALLDSLYGQTGHARFEVAPEFREMVESGKLGRKSGEGFYRY
ncbi:MAG: 3-hydroxyacyl-CoA dehydrogenase family protein [candidate division WS1 bacterium]|jgi:3-hydroxybutyryl-CoA dehydrogenase|nr:3-hydroxyacyl-CoA dehydrogenase family protein [candidate division WS1 bacterium]